MKKTMLWLLLPALMLLLAACDSGGKFRVVNQSNHPLYVQVGTEDEVTIPGGAEHTFDVSTETEHFFNPDVEKEVPVHMIGETYQIYDEEEETFTDSTTVTVKVGETTSAYITPNRAGFKIINTSAHGIESVFLYKHNFVAASLIAALGPLAPGESRFLPVDYATASNNFYYYATVEMDDSSILTFGDQTNVLLKDQQFLITLTNPE